MASAMNDTDYARQIGQMVEFIKQEATEKANEIRVAADEEFNIQKLNLVEAEKVKIRKEYERKDGQVEVKKRIEYSTQLNTARLKLLQARDDLVCQSLASAQAQLLQVSTNAASYTQLMSALIVQGIRKVQAKEVTVRCRQADVAVCQAAIGEVERSWGALVPGGGSCPAMLLDAVTFLPPGQGEGKTCSGGVAVVAEGGRIVCNNTLDARLKSAFDANLPLVRAELFK